MSDARLRQLERQALDGDEDARLRLWNHRRREGAGRDPRRDPLPGDVVGGREVVACEDTRLWMKPLRCWKTYAFYLSRIVSDCTDVHWRAIADPPLPGRHVTGMCAHTTWLKWAKHSEVTALALVE